MKHGQKACPLCGKRIEKTTRAADTKSACNGCGATRSKLLVCDVKVTKKTQGLVAVTLVLGNGRLT
jgi:hypothetical protein